MDCSWPIGYSLNDGLSKTEYLSQTIDLRYPTSDDLCRQIYELSVERPECKIMFYKEDLDRCFRQYYADLASVPLLGFKWCNMYYFDMVMMMGCRVSLAIAQ